ncbi:MAG TPA: glycosyltransferase family 9 protein [Bacteroidota bacterium]|nr:glycosyltransferase family 9 protein [Bacteroidota bacterium]
MIPLLRLIGKLVGTLAVPLDPGHAKKVLVADLSFIGDIVMTSVTHSAVRRNLPGAAIHVFGFPVVKTILPLLPVIDVLHAVPGDGKLKQVAAALRLRRERYDLAIHLNTGLWVNFLVWITGARLRLGYDFRGRGCFNNIRIPISARTVRTQYRPRECAELLERAFGWKVTDLGPSLTVDDAVSRKVRDKLRAWVVADGDFLVGIHTSSRQDREIRCWEERKFAVVANHLISRHNAKIIFTDVAADRVFVEPILAGIERKDRIVDAMGQTTIPEFCALLKRMDLLLTINTASMHLAVAMGTPLVAVLGYAPPHIYFPPGDPKFQYVMDSALGKYDPQLLVQKEPSQVREIPVEAVLEKVEYLIRHVIQNRKIS